MGLAWPVNRCTWGLHVVLGKCPEWAKVQIYPPLRFHAQIVPDILWQKFGLGLLHVEALLRFAIDEDGHALVSTPPHGNKEAFVRFEDVGDRSVGKREVKGHGVRLSPASDIFGRPIEGEADRKSATGKVPEQKGIMSINYPYYLPLSPSTFTEVRFLDLSPKTDGFGEKEQQKVDKDGTPIWVISALVSYNGSKLESELFSITATKKDAESMKGIPQFSAVKLHGLSGGKWSKAQEPKTYWSFQITGVSVA